MTIHNAESDFYAVDNPLACNLLVVDDTSMVDVLLMQPLLAGPRRWPSETAAIEPT